jgi:hypothetical protein
VAREVKTVDGWILEDELPQGNIYWPEVVERRGLHSKTYKDPASNTYRFIANTKGAPRHYRTDGTLGTGALTDIDLTNPDNIQSFYTLARLTGTAIGYQYTPRDDTNLTITIRLEGYTGTGVADEFGQVWYRDIATDLDIYSKPLPYRYGIYKVLKSAAAPTTFVFNGSATGEPQAINDAFGGSWTMAQLQSLKKIEDINTITWTAGGAEVLIPARVAWDGNGDPVQVKVTAEYVPSSKSIKLTEQVVLPENPVWPITVDTDVSYNSSTNDGTLYASNADFATACAASTATAVDNTGRLFVGYFTSAENYLVYRSAVFFATGDLPDGCTISDATLSLDGYYASVGTQSDIVIVSYAGSAPPGTDDFNDFGSTSLGSMSSADYSAGWNPITLNETGRAAINKTGDTALGLRTSRDISATVGLYDSYVMYESANTTPAPKIDITYETTTTHDGEASLVTKATLAAAATASRLATASLRSKETLVAEGKIAPGLTAAMEGECVRLTAIFREVGVV